MDKKSKNVIKLFLQKKELSQSDIVRTGKIKQSALSKSLEDDKSLDAQNVKLISAVALEANESAGKVLNEIKLLQTKENRKDKLIIASYKRFKKLLGVMTRLINNLDDFTNSENENLLEILNLLNRELNELLQENGDNYANFALLQGDTETKGYYNRSYYADWTFSTEPEMENLSIITVAEVLNVKDIDSLIDKLFNHIQEIKEDNFDKAFGKEKPLEYYKMVCVKNTLDAFKLKSEFYYDDTYASLIQRINRLHDMLLAKLSDYGLVSIQYSFDGGIFPIEPASIHGLPNLSDNFFRAISHLQGCSTKAEYEIAAKRFKKDWGKYIADPIYNQIVKIINQKESNNLEDKLNSIIL